MATPDKKLTDCYYYLQNQCIKGEQCEYRHHPGALTQTATCKDWISGACANQACDFRHPSGAPQQAKTICYYFTHGGCMKGSSCHYSHDVDVAEAETAAPRKVAINPAKASPAAKVASSAAEQELAQILQAKKKQEQELKKLQLERQKEEERLAKLRQQTTATSQATLKRRRPEEIAKSNIESRLSRPGENKQKQPISQRISRPNEEQTSRRTPAAQVDAGKPRERKMYVPKSLDAPLSSSAQPQRKGPTKSDNAAPSGGTSFGVKSLEEILKDQKITDASPNNEGERKAAPKPSPAKDDKNKIDLEAIRKRNAQKFGQPAAQLIWRNQIDRLNCLYVEATHWLTVRNLGH
eukprot:TRINITY_DN2755_c0_g1_i3.p1 TRINITY_DN2755_c0_g1~~TRINITY_DN2755_c0_g1_i3.p1  ORF type:complete len:370 (-),score=72.44 TRINITY_DN2755_c0_g1_i3:69-1121(-)